MIEPERKAGPAEVDVLRSARAGPMVVRGGVVRGVGYATGILTQAVISVFLLRYLGVTQFGEFVTVASLVAIVSNISDAGLGAIGMRELTHRSDPDGRWGLLGNLIASRILLIPLCIAAATAFAIVVGYDEVLVLGTVLAGIGVVLINVQGTMMLPLSVDLRIGTLTIFEVARQLISMLGIAILVVAGASLLPFFAVQIPTGLLLLAATPLALHTIAGLRPRFDRGEWKMLIREALPVAIAIAMNAIYFRVLIILMSLLASGTETGLYATSFRVFELAFGIPSLVLSVALPVLTTAAAEDERRFAYAIQKMIEVGFIAGLFMAMLIAILAGPVIAILGGSEYAGAASLLRIQAFALIPVFLNQICTLGLISMHRQRAMVIANGVGLLVAILLGIAFIERMGGTGAAIAAVTAETIMAAAMLGLFAAARPSAHPHFGFLWKPALGGALAAGVLLIPGIPEVIDAILAAAVFSFSIWLTKALPGEMLHAWRFGVPTA